MPLLDHFHPPLSDSISWEGIHGQWPAMLVLDLNRRLPTAYRAAPKVHIGAGLENDIAALERNPELASHRPADSSNSGAATAVYSPPEPSLSVEVALPDQDQFEVKVFDNQHNFQSIPSRWRSVETGKLDSHPEDWSPASNAALMAGIRSGVPIEFEKTYIETCQALRIV
jgi:hypothetical protein